MHSKPTDIDRLYGLEPVFEPGPEDGPESGNDALQHDAEIQCPYCGEPIGVQLDLSAGSQSYIEDCQVCCQPIQLSVQVSDSGELEALDAGRA